MENRKISRVADAIDMGGPFRVRRAISSRYLKPVDPFLKKEGPA
jgi:hypothetical protein